MERDRQGISSHADGNAECVGRSAKEENHRNDSSSSSASKVRRERPILFTPHNAQLVHESKKPQTRRIITMPPWASDDDMLKLAAQRPATGIAYYKDGLPVKRLTCPYGLVGDRLWVREPWAWPGEEFHLYKGRYADARIVEEWKKDPNCCQVKWTPSIHMPRFACRTVLEITEVRVERVQDITAEDCQAEGVDCNCDGSFDEGVAFGNFIALWESINGKGSWDLNPWVWVIAFQKVG